MDKYKHRETATVGGGVGFTGLLTILFIALKLTNVIDWKWIWVISPIWISAALTLVLLVVAVLITALSGYEE